MKATEMGKRIAINNILYLTDFSEASEAALPFGEAVAREYRCKIHALHIITPETYAYAISFAQENEAKLTLLHVIRKAGREAGNNEDPVTVANAMCDLGELVLPEAELWCRPETVVEYGNPSERILAVANERAADLIVLGVRSAANRLGAATHLERATAHKVVAHAHCPVLTVRG